MKKNETILILSLLLIICSSTGFSAILGKVAYHTSNAHGVTETLHISYDRDESIISQEVTVIDFDWKISMKKEHPRFGYGNFKLRKGLPQDPNSFIVTIERIDKAVFTSGNPEVGTYPKVEFSGYGSRRYQDGDETIDSWIFVRAWDSIASDDPDSIEIEVHDGDQVTRHLFKSEGYSWIKGDIIIKIA
jgi:hypothetical protein